MPRDTSPNYNDPHAVSVGAPAAADILSGMVAVGVTQAATTIITVPAGRTWRGTVSLACDVADNAAVVTAGQALGVISTAGATATPAAGSYFSVEARCGPNAATGTVGSQGHNYGATEFCVVAGASPATIQVTTTIGGSVGRVSASAIGSLI